MAVRAVPIFVLAAMAFAAAPLEGQRPSAHGRATIHIPELLSFRVVEEPVDGRVETVVLVTANRDWRLVMRAPDRETVVEGGPGRDHRRVLDPELARARSQGRLEVTLTPH